MYAIDANGNIHIGGRGGRENSFPHPTLIGGVNPNVICAGMIQFKQGRILRINNSSGHFKPTTANFERAKTIFKDKFPKENSFDSAFDFKDVTLN